MMFVGSREKIALYLMIRPTAGSDSMSAILAQCALRDQAAFARLYQLTSAKLFGVALRIVRRQDWAEEVLQEAYVNIWNHASDYAAARSQPMTWMTSVVRNRALDWLRRPRQEETSENYEQMIAELKTDGEGPLETLLRANEADALARCLATLDSAQRQSIALAFHYGLSHSELATHLRQPMGTIKSWIRRGLERLKTCLAQSEPR
jgi:RNA polymerase sigma-70 factor (ECF subfamily)